MRRFIIMAAVCASLASCGIYGKYERPADIGLTDTVLTVSWRDFFRDSILLDLIDTALVRNTDVKIAELRVFEAGQTFNAARLQYLPTVGIGLSGSISDVTGAAVRSWTLPVDAGWQIDIFGKTTNAKRSAEAALEESKASRSAVYTKLVADLASMYYSLLMLDEQLSIACETAAMWEQTVEVAELLKEAGAVTDAALAQYIATYNSVLLSMESYRYQITLVENSISSLLAKDCGHLERGTLAGQELDCPLAEELPFSCLGARPDVRMAEYELAKAFYASNIARAELLPSVNLTGSLDIASMVMNLGASLAMPVFRGGTLAANARIADAVRDEALASFRQTVLDAGLEVRGLLAECTYARRQVELYERQVEALERAALSTELTLTYGTTQYLEVLAARKSLLSARTGLIAGKADYLRGIVSLYQAVSPVR